MVREYHAPLSDFIPQLKLSKHSATTPVLGHLAQRICMQKDKMYRVTQISVEARIHGSRILASCSSYAMLLMPRLATLRPLQPEGPKAHTRSESHDAI